MSNWNVLAKLDPLWTILSDPQKKFGKWDPKEFFATGEQEAQRVLAMCDAGGLEISCGNLLDFGCGVGRMTRAFSNFFEACTGVDVSENMIGLAKEYHADSSRCSFIASKTQSFLLRTRLLISSLPFWFSNTFQERTKSLDISASSFELPRTTV